MDFRQKLDECRNGGETLVVSEQISCHEIPARIAAEESGRNRVVLFENIADYTGIVAANLFGKSDRVISAIGARDEAAFFKKIDQAKANPKPLNFKERDDVDYVVTGDPVLLERLPNIIHSEHEDTPYITSGVVLAKNPETGTHYVSYVRLSVREGNIIIFNPRTPRMIEVARATLKRGKSLDLVVLIGAPTEIMLLGALSFSAKDDELNISQALGGDGLAFADGELPVPLGTEIVLFGTVQPEYTDEGPFGDMKGLYLTNKNPICHVTEMWERRDARYHSILGGMSQEHVGLVRLKMLHQLEHLKNNTPTILDYRLPKFAAGQMCLLTVEDGVTLDKIDQELFDIHLIELFVLLNKDTDPDSAEDVLWAITQRTGRQGDLQTVDADPKAGRPGHRIIDATAADPTEWPNIRVNVFE